MRLRLVTKARMYPLGETSIPVYAYVLQAFWPESGWQTVQMVNFDALPQGEKDEILRAIDSAQ